MMSKSMNGLSRKERIGNFFLDILTTLSDNFFVILWAIKD